MSEKTVTVTDIHGNQVRLAADGWAVTDGELAVKDSTIEDDPVAAVFAVGQWIAAVDDSRRAPDAVSWALGVCRQALYAVSHADSLAGARKIAGDALGELEA